MINAPQCVQCGRIYRTTAPDPTQTHVFAAPPIAADVPFRSLQLITASQWQIILAILGSVVLIAGVFAPIVSAPIVGTINFMTTAEGNAVFAAGVCALLFCGVQSYLGVGLMGLLSLAMILDRCSVLMIAKSQISGSEGGMALQIQFGWVILLAGAISLVAAGAWRMFSRRNSHVPQVAASARIVSAQTMTLLVALSIVIYLWAMPAIDSKRKQRAEEEQHQRSEATLEAQRESERVHTEEVTRENAILLQQERGAALESNVEEQRQREAAIQQQNEKRAEQLSGKGYVPDRPPHHSFQLPGMTATPGAGGRQSGSGRSSGGFGYGE